MTTFAVNYLLPEIISLLRRYFSYLHCFLVAIILFWGEDVCFAQISAGPDDTITSGVPVRLTAVYGTYATPVPIADDGVEGPFPIGFTFSFFGNQYTEFYIGANGWISFSPNSNAAGTRAAFLIPSADPKNPKNAILGPFQDMQPEGGSFIFYQTIGDTLARKLVVMWCQTPMYSEFCSDSLVTFQIILHEGSNQIDNMLMKKPSCTDWLNNIATQGVQNETGYVGFAVPGHNASSWTSYGEGWRYSPVSVDSFAIAQIPYYLEPVVPQDKITYTWYEGSEYLSSEQILTVTPTESTTYRVVAQLCQGDEFTDTVNVFVIPFIPNAFTPNNDGLNDVFRMTGLPPDNITKFNFQVYDRWGKIIFSTTNISEGWNGTCNGEICPAGAYPWIVVYDDNKSRITNKGIILLIR